ncbi:MAG: GNAT family N-acetyltransferase [Coprococcus sp.]
MLKFKNLRKNCRISKKLEKLYIEAFPRNERPPYAYIKYKCMRDMADFFGIYDDNRFIGLLYTVTYKDIAYMFFFAIEEEYRGMGYGSRILSKIKHKYRDYRIVLAIEVLDEKSDNYKQRVQRKKFYTSNGFEESGIKICEMGTEYELMSCFGTVTYDEFSQLMHRYLGGFIYRFFYKLKQS